MASTAKIEELTTRLVEKVGKGNVQSLASDLQDLLKEVDEFLSVNNQLLSTVRADRCRIAGEVLNLVDELVLKERCVTVVIVQSVHPVMQRIRRCEAKARLSAFGPHYGWMVPCGHTTCVICTYKWWKKCKEAPQPTFSCIWCGTTSDQHPLQALTIEGAMHELPRLNDDDRLFCEEAAKKVGYEDDSSWDVFFPKAPIHFGDVNGSFEGQNLNANTQQELNKR
ncbi:uncharacterized protein EV420DRAFT_1485392 [Desarmillaria tabescens]|uniref:Uncharacterized protein n=1 Tax=Armillaria tabescens TaxID=1929756 RepID=A0AA39JJ46_ARMTA|nr:uncharacterized protein EV420DRAFT_1485392 [Desarmillaria tabescens]KAK0442269.1 hypothetical protein EV420DRAFT_1485392 [Desarmillaria tabescens]